MKLKISKSLIFTTPWVLAQLQKIMFIGALTILTMAALVSLSFVYIFVFDIRHWRHFHVLTGQIYFLIFNTLKVTKENQLSCKVYITSVVEGDHKGQWSHI